MQGKLKQLYQYLLKNRYLAQAEKLKDVLQKGISDETVREIKEMCNPRYLGDLFIQEFDNAYEWWNFLGDVSMEIENLNHLLRKRSEQ